MNEKERQFALGSLKQLAKCDCEPTREGRIIEGAALAEWTPALQEIAPPVPPGYILEYIAMCPDYPAGCGWIEEMYLVPAEA